MLTFQDVFVVAFAGLIISKKNLGLCSRPSRESKTKNPESETKTRESETKTCESETKKGASETKTFASETNLQKLKAWMEITMQSLAKNWESMWK